MNDIEEWRSFCESQKTGSSHIWGVSADESKDICAVLLSSEEAVPQDPAYTTKEL